MMLFSEGLCVLVEIRGEKEGKEDDPREGVCKLGFLFTLLASSGSFSSGFF